MIEHLKKQNDLDRVLSNMDGNMLDQLYLRVFSSADGELVMQDLANRCSVFHPAETDMDEGMRAAWLSIQNRMKDALNPKKEESNA